MELWREDVDEALGSLLNELLAAGAGAPATMYAGRRLTTGWDGMGWVAWRG